MILVTGGQGTLGKSLVPKLEAAGAQVRVTSRRAKGANAVKSDIAKGEGIQEAVQGVDVIIHAASRPTSEVDVEGARRLIEAAPQLKYFVYISIVGVDKHPFSYYQKKYAAEKVIMQSKVPYTIVRATQFHPFIEMVLGLFLKLPIGILPAKWQFQPIDIDETAAFIAGVTLDKPANRVLNIAGPCVHRIDELAQTWLAAQGRKKPFVQVPFPGATSAGFREGLHTLPQNTYGKVTWMDWLHKKYSA